VPERDGDEIEVRPLGQIRPFFGRRQLVGLQIALVGHDPVAGQGLPQVEAFRVVDRVGADLLRHRRIASFGGLLQQLLAGQDFEGHDVGRPENVGALPGRCFSDVGDGRRAALVQHLQLDRRVLGLEGFAVRVGQLLGEGGHDRDRPGLDHGRHGECKGSEGELKWRGAHVCLLLLLNVSEG
jgi:hypothetical protein